MTLTLEGRNILLLAGTALFIVTVSSLLMYGSGAKHIEPSVRNDVKVYAVAIVAVLTPIALLFLLGAFPRPYIAATLAAAIAIGFMRLVFSPLWLARIVSAVVAVAAAILGLIATGAFLLVSYQSDGDLFSGLELLPSPAARYAAIAMAAGAPVGLIAGIRVIRAEAPDRGSLDNI